MKKKLSLLLTFTLTLVCCVFGQLFLALSNNTAVAATSELFKVGNGASVRIGEVDGQTVKGYGIKFKATVPDNTKSYNMAIMPIDYYNYYQRLDDSIKA